MAPTREELAEKHGRIRAFLQERRLDGVVLTSSASVAWYSGGADVHVAVDEPAGVAALLVEAERVAVLTDRIEAARMAEEAFASYVAASPVPVRFEVRPWHRSLREQLALLAPRAFLGIEEAGEALPEGESRETGPKTLRPLAPEIRRLRHRLTGREVERYRWLGAQTAAGLEEAARGVRPGWTEWKVAATLDEALLNRGVQPIVTLVAADERIQRYRHPLATSNEVRRGCMLVTCARGGGLIAAATRLVHFGPLSSDLRRRHDAVVRVDAEVLAASKAGESMGRLFEVLRAAYAAQGFPGEEELHHQGGVIGYAGREYLAKPNSTDTLVAPQALAWNPSIAGTKSEDTYLLPENPEQGLECLTAGEGAWPRLRLEVGGQVLFRPDILVL
ncbi:MAG: M24 family metallopeptidase [Betaproteobacteria bacterium]